MSTTNVKDIIMGKRESKPATSRMRALIDRFLYHFNHRHLIQLGNLSNYAKVLVNIFRNASVLFSFFLWVLLWFRFLEQIEEGVSLNCELSERKKESARNYDSKCDENIVPDSRSKQRGETFCKEINGSIGDEYNFQV